MSWYSERQLFPGDSQGSRSQCVDLLQNFLKKTGNYQTDAEIAIQQHEKTTVKKKKTQKNPRKF